MVEDLHQQLQPQQVPVLGHLMSHIILTLRYAWEVTFSVAFGVIHIHMVVS